MTEPIEIRRLQAADVEDYRTIRLAALKTEPEAFGSVHAVEVVRPVADFAERISSSVVLGAYSEGRIVGMVGFKQETGPKDSHKGFIWGFYVAPDYRRHGIASALTRAIVEAARGVVEQLILTVVQDNKAAIALYKRHGFEIYGVEPRALKTSTGYYDEVLMVLFLQPA